MSLNYLFHRHQTSLMRAAAATLPEVRAAHNGLAAGYAVQIDALRDDLRVTGKGGPHVG